MDYQLRNEDAPMLKVWRRESMEFILAGCQRRRIPAVPPVPTPSADGSFQVTLHCDSALAGEVRDEFNQRPIQRYASRRR